MQIRTVHSLQTPTDVLVVAAFDDNFSESPFTDSLLSSVDQYLEGSLREACLAERFRGAPGQCLVLQTSRPSGGFSARRLYLVGLGQRSAASVQVLHGAAASASRFANSVRASSLVFAFASPPPPETKLAHIGAVAFGLEMGAYRFEKYLSADKRTPGVLERADILDEAPKSPVGSNESATAIERGLRLGRAVSFARDLVNEPPSFMTPATLASATVARATAAGATARVFSRSECDALGMGLFLAVAKGSETEPQFVHLIWKPTLDPDASTATPRRSDHRWPCVVLVGKGVTFDSGGLSLKNTEGMLDMKTDMAGAAAVLAALAAIAEEGLPVEVHALAACTENMLSDRSYKLGDVLRSKAGKTVEINNTDAEGRLTLADAITYGLELRPDAILDFATLTGACIVALGPHTAGVMSNHDKTLENWLAAARAAGEDMWPLPLPPRLAEQLKSDIADLKNTGERWGGALTAGHFLKEFVGQTPWIHVDLAGPSTASKESGLNTKGATGFGVASIVEYVRRLATTPSS